MIETLLNLIQAHHYFFYAALIIIGVLEGPIISIAVGFLIHLGYVSPLPAYAALMLGDIIGDAGWYALGYYYGSRFIRRFGRFFSISEQNVAKVEKIFHAYKLPILLISKITTGFGFAIVTLFTAGMVKIPFRLYILLNVIGQFFWTAALLLFGYFFGQLYTSIDGIFGKAALIAGFLAVCVLAMGFSKYLAKRVNNHSSA